MGTPTGTKVVLTEFSGKYKLLIITATIGTADDDITLTRATHGIGTIVGVVGVITGGLSANFANIQVSYSSLVITVLSFKAAGTAADTFSGTTVEIWVTGL